VKDTNGTMRFSALRVWAWTVGTVLALITCYAVNSYLGAYQPSPSGAVRFMTFTGPRGARIDSLVWQPYFGRHRRVVYSDSDGTSFTSGDLVGKALMPLIEWDREYWHKTRFLKLAQDGSIVPGQLTGMVLLPDCDYPPFNFERWLGEQIK
jgi:hypothetical protein